MTQEELYKKVIDAQRAFEERHIPIYLDFKIEDLRDVLVETKDTIEKLKQKLEEKDSFIKTLGEGQADLAREIERLKRKLEDAKATAYAESVDAGMENRRLKRALWIARAKRALEKIAWFRLWNASISTMDPEDGARQEFDKWKKNLGKILKKEEEYK